MEPGLTFPGHHWGWEFLPIFQITARWGLQTWSQPGRTPCVLSSINTRWLCRADHQEKNSQDPPKDLPPARVSHELRVIRIGFWSRYVWSLVFEESAIHYKLNICSCLPVAGRWVSHYWQGKGRVVITKPGPGLDMGVTTVVITRAVIIKLTLSQAKYS